MTLDDPDYLLSVVETIVDSPSAHDLLDAYTTFVNRVRSQSFVLETCHTLLPALAPLSVRSDAFIRALRRDVCLAHIDLLSSLSRPLDELSLGDSVLSIKPDAKQYARDSSSLCHHALCVLTTIFRFPAFHLAFSEHLSTLFGDVLDIALADRLPVLNDTKTYSLSLSALASHRLPVSILDSRRDDVFSALQRSLDGARQPGSILLDGLKAISHTIEHHPCGFLYLLSTLLPQVMRNLHCESFERRLHASIVLGKFANALFHQTELSLTKWQTLSNHITSFLESYCNESQAAPGDTGFLCIVRAALFSDSRASPGVAPTRMLAVLASLIVLCGPSLYNKPTVLRSILQALAMALTHKLSIVRALHPHVWRCFVWTFGRMFLSSEEVEPALISSAFYVIKQEVSGGIGIALVNLLLSDRVSATRSEERIGKVSQALSVIKAMVRSECKHTRREGFMFLQALTNDNQVRQGILPNTHEIPASVLLNGAIIRAEWDSLPFSIHSIPKVPVSVRWLEQTEIARHYKTLLGIWKHFATKVDEKDLDPGLVDVWLSILIACSRQIEREQHTTTTTDMLRYTAATMVGFLPSVTLGDCQPDWGSWNVRDQLHSLAFIDQLWFAMRKAFVALCLAEAAALLLTSILKLCVDLMTTASPSFLRDMHVLTPPQLVIRSQRELWGVIATSLSSSELNLDCKDLVKFLAIPICTWVLSKPELEVWEALLRNAFAVSGDPDMVIKHFVLQYFQGRDIETWESIIAVLGFLLSYTHEHGGFPTGELLSMVDVCLIVSYSRARHSPEVLTHSLELLNLIRRVIVSVPGKVIHIIQVLCSSLCLWIEDHSEIMSDDEFNSVAVSLYCEALEALKSLPLSIQFLQDMENFLASAFSRIPTPAIAPFAFEHFWRATYHGRSQFFNMIPLKIKSCLACFVAAYGGDLADGLSLATRTQSQSISHGSEIHFSASHLYQGPGEFSLRVSPSSPSMNTEACAELFDTEVAPHGHRQILTGQDDTTFLIPSPDDAVLHPTTLRQLHEHSSRMDASSVNEAERSISNLRMLLSPILSPSDAMLSSRLTEINFISCAPNQKRKRKPADNDGAPQKQSRASRDALRTVRKVESEPATRDVTPINVPRMNSVPLKKRKVFDGVQVPTFREVLRRKVAQRAETSNLGTGQRPVQPPSSCSAQRMGPSFTVPSSVGGCDGDNPDWENSPVDATSSEVDVDRSLLDVHPSSSRTRTPAPRELDDKSCIPSGLSFPKAESRSEGSSSAPASPSLRRTKTTSTRLDALRDIYSSVANGASQIPMSELLQATRLVHQIGAALTEQMGKKIGDAG